MLVSRFRMPQIIKNNKAAEEFLPIEGTVNQKRHFGRIEYL